MLKACNRKYRRMVHLRVVQAIQKMNAAGTGGGNTHPELAREFRVGAGHKSGSLFMPHMNEPYPLLLLAESLEDSIDAIARQDRIWCQLPRRSGVLRVCPMRRSYCISETDWSFLTGQTVGRMFGR